MVMDAKCKISTEFDYNKADYKAYALPPYWKKNTHYYSYWLECIPEGIVNKLFSIKPIDKLTSMLHMKRLVEVLLKAPFTIFFACTDKLHFKIHRQSSHMRMAEEMKRSMDRGQFIEVDGKMLVNNNESNPDEKVKKTLKHPFYETFDKVEKKCGEARAEQILDFGRILLFDSPLKSWINRTSRETINSNCIFSLGNQEKFLQVINSNEQTSKGHIRACLVGSPQDGKAEDAMKTEPFDIFWEVYFQKGHGRIYFPKKGPTIPESE